MNLLAPSLLLALRKVILLSQLKHILSQAFYGSVYRRNFLKRNDGEFRVLCKIGCNVYLVPSVNCDQVLFVLS